MDIHRHTDTQAHALSRARALHCHRLAQTTDQSCSPETGLPPGVLSTNTVVEFIVAFDAMLKSLFQH